MLEKIMLTSQHNVHVITSYMTAVMCHTIISFLSVYWYSWLVDPIDYALKKNHTRAQCAYTESGFMRVCRYYVLHEIAKYCTLENCTFEKWTNSEK